MSSVIQLLPVKGSPIKLVFHLLLCYEGAVSTKGIKKCALINCFVVPEGLKSNVSPSIFIFCNWM